MRRRAVAVLALAGGLLLSACGAGDSPPAPSTSGTSVSAPPTEVESAGSTDVPTQHAVEAPTPADEALVDDHVGAIWAARHFFDLFAYMNQSGDTAAFSGMSAADCQFCASSIDDSERLAGSRGWIEGGQIELDVDEATAEYPTDSEPNYLVRFEAVEQPSTTHNGDGSVTSRDGGQFDAVVALQFVDGRFVVFGVNAE